MSNARANRGSRVAEVRGAQILRLGRRGTHSAQVSRFARSFEARYDPPMNDRRLDRLKRLALGAALVSATAFAEDPSKAAAEPKHINAVPRTPHVNAPPVAAVVDAGTPEAAKPAPNVHVNSPKPKTK